MGAKLLFGFDISKYTVVGRKSNIFATNKLIYTN